MTAGGTGAGNSFVHLHVHTEYSMLDGAARLKDMFAACRDAGMPAVAITDHGNVYGAYDFWSKAIAAGVKPIIGIEAYVAPEHRRFRQPVRWGTPAQKDDDVSGAGAYTHMTLLAETTEGMHNLFRLSSLASLEGFFRKPRMDRELLARHARGIIATTGCPSGEVQTRLRLGQYGEALAAAAAYRDIFGPGNFFCEIMDHGLEIETRVRDGLRRVARDLSLPYLVTNDSHYTRPDDATAHEVLLAVQTLPRWPTRTGSGSRARAITSRARRRCARSAPTRSGRQAATPPWRSPPGRRSRSPSPTSCPTSPCRPARPTRAGSAKRSGAAWTAATRMVTRTGAGSRPASRWTSWRPWGSAPTSWLSPTSSCGPSATGYGSAPGAARRPAAWCPTRWASPILTPSTTGWSSSGSSTPSACPCPTSTSTSTSAGAVTSSGT